jgi:NAD(P)-dependent dehydrogenase (short-subunit alcohol dehydrogenase family)
LINVGSEVSAAVVPLQGMYTASKHVVKGFTGALRVEVEEVEEVKISAKQVERQRDDEPARNPAGALFQPNGGGQVHGRGARCTTTERDSAPTAHAAAVRAHSSSALTTRRRRRPRWTSPTAFSRSSWPSGTVRRKPTSSVSGP